MRLILPEHERIPIPGLVPSLAFFGPILILWLPSNAYRSLLCAFLCLALVPLPGLIDTFGDTDKNCGQGAWVAFVILHLIDRIWLSDSETDFQRILAEDENGKLVFEPAPRPVTWKRLKWASELATTHRGIGWNWLVRNTPQPKQQSRFRFVVTWFAKGTLWFICCDLSYILLTKIAYPLSDVRITAMPPTTRALFLITFCLRAYGFMVCPFYWAEAIVVLLGFYRPEDFSPIYGSVREAYSIRGFWNKFWHQALRRPLSRLSHLTLKRIGLQRNTLLYVVLHVLIVFSITTLFHVHVVLLLGGSGIGQIKFYMLQALGIIAEMMLQTYTSIRIPRWLGYLQVAAWLYWTAPYYVEELLRHGNWATPLEGMFVEGAMKRQGYESYGAMIQAWSWD